MSHLKLMTLGRQCVLRGLLRPKISTSAPRSSMSTRNTAYEEMEKFWTKNRQLNRPMSPHLSVYKFHLTMALSITNRVAGTAQQVVLTGAPLLLMLTSSNFTQVFQAIKDLDIPAPVILGAKFIIALPFAFHLVAGLRHLAWDAGIGFGPSAVKQGGWAILVGTLVLTALLALYKPKLTEEKK